MFKRFKLTNIQELEAESIEIIREVVAVFENPVMLYSIGKDSSVMLHLARKAFYPAPIPFPLLHIDTTYKFPEMISFRDEYCRRLGVELKVYKYPDSSINPYDNGTINCCAKLKTKALLSALKEGRYDAILGGARRDEEKSRAKERLFSFRDAYGQWNPQNQRPELWNNYNCELNVNESMRIFPLSNWTELDIWSYIAFENIPVVSLYFAKERNVVKANNQLIPVYDKTKLKSGEIISKISCRYRTLGCYPCTSAIFSKADTIEKIIQEISNTNYSERITRIIDYDQEGSMEQKKQEGYF